MQAFSTPHVHNDADPVLRRGSRHGFTMVEILLVVAIILIVSSITMPMFIRSYHASNLRAGARTVVTAGKYARNMAVLQQKQITVFFNSHTGQIDIVAVDRASGARVDAFLDARRGQEDDSFATSVLRSQKLPEQVRIVDFSAPSQSQELEGVYWVNYFPSGVSDSFSMRISDENRRHSVVIEVDHLAGTVATSYE